MKKESISKVFKEFKKGLPKMLSCEYDAKICYSSFGSLIEVVANPEDSESVRRSLPLTFMGYQVVVIIDRIDLDS